MDIPMVRRTAAAVRATIVLIAAVMIAGIAFTLAGCSEPQSSQGVPKKYPYKVVTTVAMVSDIVKQVAGDKATVEGLIGEGVDPHSYAPTRNDVTALMGADVIFYSGLMLEGKMTDTFVKVGRQKKVYAVTELLDESALLTPKDMGGHVDPHVWMSVKAWSKAVEAVGNSLAEYDPPNAQLYRANATAYRNQLDELDKYVTKVIATVPERSRVMITAHDAFNYFGQAYNLEVLGIQGLSTESEAGLADIQKLVDMIVQRDIKAVFVESSVSEKNIRSLIEGAKARGKDVKIGGQLFSDAMGQAGTYEGTYIGMIDHNATLVARALGGDAPERGMQGKLKVP
jgi:manganese/zinc/iron transport system substrate-binding protein